MNAARPHSHRFVVLGAVLVGAAVLAGVGDARTAATAPSNNTRPTISGTAQVGQTLTAGSGSWSGSPAPTFAYAWQRCDGAGGGCGSIAGAAASTYVVSIDDVGHTLRVEVTATNSAGSATADSVVTAPIPTVSPPANTALPTISGPATLNATLTAAKGTWTGSGTITYAYQWNRCDGGGASCAAIAGATTTTHAVVSADIGHTLRVVVTATNAGGSAQQSSSATAVVTSSPASTVAPAVSGSAVPGQTLSASTGTWVGVTPISYTYAWQRCDSNGNNCSAISGAAASTYVLTSSDVGHTVRATVTAKNSAGSASATSPATGVVSMTAPANTAAPALTGTATQGQTLTVSNGTWSGTSPLTYAYVWTRCDANENNCVLIAGATASTYVLTSTDAGHKVHATVTATNGAGSAHADSNAVGPVASTLPAGAVKLPNGEISIPATSLPATDHLRIAAVKMTPARGSRGSSPVTITFTVRDDLKYVVSGALVYALVLPPSWATKTREAPTVQNGTVAISIKPSSKAPRSGALYVLVRVRVPGRTALSTSTGYRLVSVRLSRS